MADAAISAVEPRLSGLTANDLLVQQLLTPKGIGPIIAVTIRAEIGRFRSDK